MYLKRRQKIKKIQKKNNVFMYCLEKKNLFKEKKNRREREREKQRNSK